MRFKIKRWAVERPGSETKSKRHYSSESPTCNNQGSKYCFNLVAKLPSMFVIETHTHTDEAWLMKLRFVSSPTIWVEPGVINETLERVKNGQHFLDDNEL